MICNKCGLDKPSEAFKKGGKQCKECINTYQRLYYSNNPEKYRKYRDSKREYRKRYNKAYGVANRERLTAKKREYRLANPEKVCEQQKAWKANNPNYSKEYEKKRYQENKEEIKAKVKTYRSTKAGKRTHVEDTKRYRTKEENKVKRRAHQIVYRAIKSGELVKPTKCSVCGRVRRIEAHHDDYNKPLEVKWCCSQCHKDLRLQVV